ncbi:hypothetical protein [Urbifossiella limnaea]|uniref:Uncharacterized protein n=1 Tax=Urbifossiella limnaea TaxID=2528023 RepID=A0A517XLP5_9BACT|nr:hypothetical protein [Urbifossiella limnaea]QDU18428.1 hypothetical protein ETAA1_03140 [Urbifossiella limnaea]
MRRFALLAVCVLALAGCKKKPKPAPAEPEPAPGLKKDGLPQEGPAPSGGGGGGGGGIIAAGGGIGVVNPVQALGGGGGGGAAMAVRKAARRTQALNELKNIGEIIFAMQIETGRMPTVPQILEELKRTPQLLTGVSEGAYVLTGTTEAGGLYAFEVDADKQPGIAVIGGRATRSTPEELRPYLLALPPSVLQPQQPQQPPRQPAPQPMGKIDNRPMPPQPAGQRIPVGQKDMEDVRIFIDNFSGAGGRMPTQAETRAALQMSGTPAFGLVQRGAITLTGATTREGVWAYETAAANSGGLIAGANGTETVTPAEFARRLGR